MSTIPAKQLVSVIPSVLGAGGAGLDIIGLFLSPNTRIPIGSVLSFPDGPSVTTYFGAGSAEDVVANGGVGQGDGYFGSFTKATKLPAAILFAQYNANAVAAFLRGGSIASLTLAQLQALSGSLNIVVDGYARNASSVNLSASTSFTSAASIIATALNAADPTEATVTAALGATATGAISGTTLTISAVTGLISVGDSVAGSGVTAGTVITALGSGTGGTGTYTVNNSQTVGSEALVISSNVLNVTAVGSGAVAVGEYVTGAGVTSAVITAQLTGSAGSTGHYSIAGSPQQVASESMTITGTPVAVTYDSVSGGFVITSGITGANSTIAFTTGTISSSIKLTSATGAVTSQGAAAAATAGASAAFMNALIVTNSNWVTFTTVVDPDGGSGNTIKQALAAWKNTQDNRFAYVPTDTDITPTESVPATSSLGYILANNGDSGTCLVYEPVGANLNTAPFVMGVAASIDFTQRNGRINFAYKEQSDLVAGVTDGTTAVNLGGQPLVPFSYGNGYNFYGAYGAANAGFVDFQRGLVTGDYRWLDSYINQIWLNNSFQAALLNLLRTAFSVPYSTAGNGLIEAALADPIQAGLNFGAFGPGVLSSVQIALVNSQAGARISDTLQTQGYYLQILPATASVRSARTSPPIKFWYIDKGSVQAIAMSSIALT